MTKEEAIKKLNVIKEYLTAGNPIWDVREIDEVLDMAIEALQARHGKWQITEAYPHIVYCSECHRRYAQTNWQVWNDEEYPLPRNYCPNCGADMRGEE